MLSGIKNQKAEQQNLKCHSCPDQPTRYMSTWSSKLVVLTDPTPLHSSTRDKKRLQVSLDGKEKQGMQYVHVDGIRGVS